MLVDDVSFAGRSNHCSFFLVLFAVSSRLSGTFWTFRWIFRCSWEVTCNSSWIAVLLLHCGTLRPEAGGPRMVAVARDAGVRAQSLGADLRSRLQGCDRDPGEGLQAVALPL